MRGEKMTPDPCLVPPTRRFTHAGRFVDRPEVRGGFGLLSASEPVNFLPAGVVAEWLKAAVC
jgi:hypothetical protein